MTIQELKYKLLNTGYFINNEYLDKYCNLIIENLETKIQPDNITENHHILQVAYFKNLCLPIDNSKDNLVNLLYKDHVLAHQYLALCTLKFLEVANILAFNLMVNYSLDFTQEINLQQLNDLQELKSKWGENYLKTRVKSITDSISELSYDKIYQYYIIENHSYYETAKYFKISTDVLEAFKKAFNIHKKHNLKYYKERISKEDIIKYYIEENHSYYNTIKHFELEEGMFLRLCREYNIKKINRVRRFKYIQDNLSSININDINNYYIVENHNKEETCNHFNISNYLLNYIIRNYNLSKGRGHHKSSRGKYKKK